VTKAAAHRDSPAGHGARARLREALCVVTAAWWLVSCTSSIVSATAPANASASPDALPLDELIARLGAEEFHVREAAAAALRAAGPAAIDDLLRAAETSQDLEVALQARWLVDTIPLDMPHDPPPVARLLAQYRGQNIDDRGVTMHRLMDLDDEAGIEALARIVRLDRSTLCSRRAAALLAAEWYPDDPAFDRLRPRITAGLGASQRPAAVLLRALVEFDAAGDDAGRSAALVVAEGAWRTLAASTPPLDALDDWRGDRVEPSNSIFAGVSGDPARDLARLQIRLLAAAGRRDDAIATARDLLRDLLPADRPSMRAATKLADTLVWCVHEGLPEAVDALLDPPLPWLGSVAVTGFAVAHAERSRGRDALAAPIAEAAFTASRAAITEQPWLAGRVAHWGCGDWAARLYQEVIDRPTLVMAVRIEAAIRFAEFLHDGGDDAAAARIIRETLERRDGRKDLDDMFNQLQREQAAVRSRQLYFEACAARARGDGAAARAAIEASLAANGKDVDSLIALYKTAADTPAELAAATERVEEALRQIENIIQAVPEDSNSYNEYAWLVSNTTGDLERATRYSRISLDRMFDSPAYLDTLAHCRAAAGDYDGAARWQTRAWRREPASPTIKRNLDRFRRLAATPAR